MKHNHNQSRWHLQTDEAPLKPDHQNPLADSTWEWQTCPNMVSSTTTAATSTQSHRGSCRPNPASVDTIPEPGPYPEEQMEPPCPAGRKLKIPLTINIPRLVMGLSGTLT